mmetsp:Transcript_88708/g.248189  ORF Transcript_88708/g.248189 Transcript_88708/m.248189 type:complete len:267 (+) Transcript_88708:204-1004(+)
MVLIGELLRHLRPQQPVEAVPNQPRLGVQVPHRVVVKPGDLHVELGPTPLRLPQLRLVHGALFLAGEADAMLRGPRLRCRQLEDGGRARTASHVVQQATGHHRPQVTRVCLSDGLVLAAHNPRQQRHLIPCIEGVLKRAQLVHHAPVRPDVALLVVGLLLAHLGRQVVGGANQGLREARGLAEDPCNAQVPNTDVVNGVQKHVQRLDVPVEDPVRMQPRDPDADLQSQLPHHGLLQRFAALGLEIRSQVPMLAVLHDDVQGVTVEK